MIKKKTSWVFNTSFSIGFFCAFWSLIISNLGSMNFLPLTMEWPVGFTSRAITVGDKHYVVPIDFASRVQIYDDKLNFERSVWIDPSDGVVEIYPADKESFWVYKTQGKSKLKININGEVLMSSMNETFPAEELNKYVKLEIPTSFFPYILTNFDPLWLIGMMSFLVAYVSQRKKSRDEL